MIGTPRRVALAAALLATGLSAGTALAQKAAGKYPTKPVRMIVPFVPGGGTDIVARALAQKLSEQMGESFVVDNHGGGGGTIGAEMTVRATPDGYTIAVVSGSYGTNAALFKLDYDPVNDITPIALLGETGFLVVVHPSVPVKSIKELIALAKAKPGYLNYGSTGTGGITHLATELFTLMTDTKMVHVPYKGTGAALNDLLGNHVQLMFGAMPAMVPQHKAGRLRGIAVTTLKPNNAVPDIPTVADPVPGYEAVLWYGSFGPKNMPQDIVARLNTEMGKALTSPAMQERLAGEGLDAGGGPPQQMLNMLQREVPKWTKVVREAHIAVIQ